MKKTNVRKRRKRRIAVWIVVILIVAVAAAAGVLFYKYQDKGNQLDQLMQSELAKQEEYTQSITSVSLPEGWSQDTLAKLQEKALAAYDDSLLQDLEKAQNGDDALAQSLENAQSSTLSEDAQKYQKLFKNLDSYPEDIVKMILEDSANMDFVLSYSSSDNSVSDGSTTEKLAVTDFSTVPNLKTANSAWGFTEYNGGLFAKTGSAPTALAMVLSYILEDPTITPYTMAQFAIEYGYDTNPVSADDSLFGAAGYTWYVNMTPIPAYVAYVDSSLEQGSVVIAQVGSETSSKFIVITALSADGQWKVLDPTSADGLKTVDPSQYKDSLISAFAFW